MTQSAPPGSVAATNESGWTTAPNFEKYILHFLKLLDTALIENAY
jgi:hypothetical protein